METQSPWLQNVHLLLSENLKEQSNGVFSAMLVLNVAQKCIFKI